MRNLCTQVINAANATTKTSSAVNSNQLVSLSVHAYNTDATAAGTLKVQASNELLYSPNTPTHWVDVPSATATMAANTPGLVTIPNMTYQWVRVVYTQTTPGSGNVVVSINGLSI